MVCPRVRVCMDIPESEISAKSKSPLSSSTGRLHTADRSSLSPNVSTLRSRSWDSSIHDERDYLRSSSDGYLRPGRWTDQVLVLTSFRLLLFDPSSLPDKIIVPEKQSKFRIVRFCRSLLGMQHRNASENAHQVCYLVLFFFSSFLLA